MLQAALLLAVLGSGAAGRAHAGVSEDRTETGLLTEVWGIFISPSPHCTRRGACEKQELVSPCLPCPSLSFFPSLPTHSLFHNSQEKVLLGGAPTLGPIKGGDTIAGDGEAAVSCNPTEQEKGRPLTTGYWQTTR